MAAFGVRERSFLYRFSAMIFVTVGTQGRFDRLIRTVDDWAGTRGLSNVFAQTGPSDFRPQYISAKPFISACEFRQCIQSANLIISHAGMGSIITALELGKKIIVMPRRSAFGEHRNDHQVATAKRFAEQGRIISAEDERELLIKLDQIQSLDNPNRSCPEVSAYLINTIQMFIETGSMSLGDRDTSP